MAAGRGRNIVAFCLRFILCAPLCLVLWLVVMPLYTWLLGHVTGLVLTYILRAPIQDTVVAFALSGDELAVNVAEGGVFGLSHYYQLVFNIIVLATRVQLTYVVDGHWLTMSAIGHLVANLAPFTALVLATPALPARRRLKIIAIGAAIIFVSHGATIVFRFSAGKTALPTAIGFLSITLPFLLWIVLAYWKKLRTYFIESMPRDDSAT